MLCDSCDARLEFVLAVSSDWPGCRESHCKEMYTSEVGQMQMTLTLLELWRKWGMTPAFQKKFHNNNFNQTNQNSEVCSSIP